MTALLALLILCQSPSTDAEIFIDRGETYIRAGTLNGLEVGSALEILDAKSHQPIGSALVMEVWESLSRVSLDSKAVAFTALKVARVGRPAQPFVQAQATQPAGPVAAEPAAPIGLPAHPPAQAGAWLDGSVTVIGAGEGRRVIIKNRSNRDWHNCDVRLPNGKHYWIGDLDEGDDEGVMLFRFDHDRRGPAQPVMEGVTVVCREGTGRYPISF